MSQQAYVGMTKRTFQQALVQLLQQEYALIGSRRVLELLADDVQHLIDQFYPAPQRLRSGWLVLTGTKATGPKAYPGQSATDHHLVTLAWPVLLPEDIEFLARHPDTKEYRHKWLTQRLVRIIEYGCNHADGPVLLTLADLAALVSLTPKQVSQLLKQARLSTGKPLLTKGLFFDQGMRPTHKAQIVELYEQGLDEADIARQSDHSPSSVGRYLRDYERVKLLIKREIPIDQISHLIGMQPGVINAYVKLIHKYHPDLLPDPISSP
jgi:hypothetical protein